ncbi:bifunctional 4-hydroxy-2-oxoglutarate aldolase/2-dehydro-3-deoxy-phosphogluconate aldolase [Microlunatus aurantiacus]|uniref:2-dehydro-3-deoxy-phosphogluconate aldolase n=1 Tax=Microlunatus aurantiacus TaxID=446786 RepID=A0ABP7DE03_9ACTN
MTLTTSPLDVSAVIPVVVIDDPAHAVPLARALVAGGVSIIEVTLRTPRALDAVAAIAAEVPEIALGVGSLLTASDVDQALTAGAEFLVSPGASPALLESLVAAAVPVLPGVATVSEVLTALDRGLTELKFFPAGPAGGPAYLAAVGGPVPQVRFCPTGGVTPDNLRDYLAVPGVAAVGGTWLAPRASIAAEDWAGIAAQAAAVRGLISGVG